MISSNTNRSGAAFLLAQVGGHAAARFAERLAPLGLASHHAGILRIVNSDAGITQQALAKKLSMLPSRLVVLIDELEQRGLIKRGESATDRRRYELQLTDEGRSALEAIGAVAREHSRSLLASLSSAEQHTLADLLQRIADQQNLTRSVHPGYSRLKPAPNWRT